MRKILYRKSYKKDMNLNLFLPLENKIVLFYINIEKGKPKEAATPTIVSSYY